jgi:hypothetical protein
MQAERSKAVTIAAAGFAPKPGVAGPRRIEVSDPRADGRRRVVLLARDRVTIARSVAGVFMHIAMKPDAYSGVVLRLVALSEGIFHYEIRLAHRDPDLSITLHEASDDSDVQAEWRLWARFLGLPALVEREEGRPEPDRAHLGAVAVSRTRPRRRGKTILSRRARFLTRRKTGRLDPSRRLAPDPREMFPGSGEGR